MNSAFRFLAASASLSACLCCSQADVRPNQLFSEGVVLQRGREVPVWGTAAEGEKVTIKIQDQTVTVVAEAGRWMVRLKPLQTGGPFTLTIRGENTITLTNVLVGEVWLCSGQSNMAFALARAEEAHKAVAEAADPHLRFFTVARAAVDKPLAEPAGEWAASRPETAANFSAVAYFFGRDLRRSLGVPIGLINASVGGTPAEAWTPVRTLEADPALKEILDRHARAVRTYDASKAGEDHRRALERHRAEAARAKREGRVPPRAPRAPSNPIHGTKRPSGLYNGMIAPLQPFAVAGVIWYQGEANSGRAAEYQKLFPAMIQAWRQAWGQGDFPFLFVQIAPHQSMTPEIREAQWWTWRTVPRTGMAVTVDIGDERDIHPKQKEPVGARLALAARAIAYGENIEYSGPVFDSMRLEDNRAILAFHHTGGGLVSKGGELKGFSVAGETGGFEPARAIIEGDRVIVSAPAGMKPKAVRYGWSNTPSVNLFNKEGLPAVPFRTDAARPAAP